MVNNSKISAFVDTVKNLLSDKEDNSNKVTSWSNTTTDAHYPSEKLVKDSLDSKASITDLNNSGAYTIHTVYSVNGTASAYDISSGLSYAQLNPVFFLVKNNIGDNEANATLKYYPNGNNITIIDTSINSYSPIQQGAWKKDTWALFFCAGNNTVQLRCVFYDGIDDIGKIINLLRIENLSYYVVSSVSKDSKRVTYNVADTTIYDGNSFYLKVPYYETSTDVRVIINHSSSPIKQGSDYVTESQVNGHLLKLRYNNSIFEVLSIYGDKLVPFFSDLSNVATSGSYTDLSDKPTIPTASTNTPLADTSNGSVGNNSSYAKADHTHPKSSLYAESSHTHSGMLTTSDVKDNLTSTDTNKPLSAKQGKELKTLIDAKPNASAIPTVTSQLSNDGDGNGNKYVLDDGVKTINNQSILGTGNISIGSDKENVSNKVTSISSSSTDTQYPSAKCVYDELQNTIGTIVDMVYPVGSIYMSVNSVNPSTLFGGTWEQIEDKFLLASGTNYANGTTGGEATHTLTKNEMPSHTHTQNAHSHNMGYRDKYAITGNARSLLQYGASASEGNVATNSVTATNQNTGGGQAHNNMPPYLAVNVWKRTA